MRRKGGNGMALLQLEFDFGSVVCTSIVHFHPDVPQIKTAILGELPNDCGVYVCPPDEVFEWTYKRDSVKVNLLRLENGKHLLSYKIFVGTSGLSTPLWLSDYCLDSRDKTLEYARNTLRGCYILDDELPAPLKKSLGKFIDGLV